MTEGQLDEEIINIVRNLDKEEISNPINSSGGYYIIPVSYTHLTLPTNREV